MGKSKRPLFLAVAVIGVLFAAGIFFFWVDSNAAFAQCGSSVSSCKNCHEVNAKNPVNGSGEWHTKHAFGDFCVFCHGGDVQATVKTVAHTGMYYPLADPKQSCQSCHTTDTNQRAQVYATILKIDLKNQGGAAPASGNTGNGSSSADTTNNALKPIDSPGDTHASGAIIDFNRRYDLEVLGLSDQSRTGNMILVGLGLFFAVVGLGLVYRMEHLDTILKKARAVPEWTRLAETGVFAVPSTTADVSQRAAQSSSIPPSVMELPKEVGALDLETQAALQKLLADPEHGSAILRALSRLDPALIDSLQGLDKQDRALLIAIVEKLGESKS